MAENDCQFCAKLTEETLANAIRNNVPLMIPRLWLEVPWKHIDEFYCATFMCDACGCETYVRINLYDGPDPADWWKTGRKPE